jgi:hypothetical protein
MTKPWGAKLWIQILMVAASAATIKGWKHLGFSQLVSLAM